MMVFHGSLNDIKSPQIPRTLLSILGDLNAVVWMVSACPPISNFSSPLNKPFGTIPSAPITTGLIVTFMFQGFFFNSLASSKYLSVFSFFFLDFSQ